MRHGLIGAAVTAVILAGCAAAPTREDVSEFKLIAAGRIPVDKVGLFSDCLIDGFDKARTMPTAVHTRQVKRTGLTRVESLLDSGILVSADVHDDGRIELHESSVAALIPTTGEAGAFATCSSRFDAKKADGDGGRT